MQDELPGQAGRTIPLLGALPTLPARRWVRLWLPFDTFVALHNWTRESGCGPEQRRAA